MPTSPLPSRHAARGPVRAWLQLLRPANVATAPADVLAGAAIAGALLPPTAALGWLLLATMALYAGGIVLNDVFDRHVDAVERPERPLPSGLVPVAGAAMLGIVLLGGGILLATRAGGVAGWVAFALAAMVVLYDARSKHHPLAGPITMGLCRALNLMLGVAIVPTALTLFWPLALVPLTYITAVTLVSRGEVHGSRKAATTTAFVMVVAVAATLGALALTGGRAPALPSFDRLATTLVAAWFAWRVLPPFLAAARSPLPAVAGRAVRTGVLSLVLVDGVIAGAYTGIMGIPAVLATGLVAWLLARLFAVT